MNLGNLGTVFELLDGMTQEDPVHAPHLLALLMAGGPFRAILNREDLMRQTLRLAADYVRSVDVVAKKDAQAADPLEAKALSADAQLAMNRHFHKA